jgi:hypothetical protein
VSSLDDAVLISPASPIESSPLSSPPGEPDIKAVETYEDEVTDTYEDEATVAHEDEAANGARKSGSAGTTPPVHEGSAKDERNLPFECPDCEKAYATEKSLKVGRNVARVFASLLTIFVAPHQRQEVRLFQGARGVQ